jgi:hypothetical protein
VIDMAVGSAKRGNPFAGKKAPPFGKRMVGAPPGAPIGGGMPMGAGPPPPDPTMGPPPAFKKGGKVAKSKGKGKAKGRKKDKDGDYD